jgi:hypothetical protein
MRMHNTIQSGSIKKAVLIPYVLLLLSIPLTLFFLHPWQEGHQQATGGGNPIQQENQHSGTTQWQLNTPAPYSGNRFPAIEGYAWKQSTIAGQTLSFSVSTTSPSFTAEIYRLGWYGGMGARLITALPRSPGHFYAIAPRDATTGLVDNHWPAAFAVTIDPSWTSGIYLVKLTATNGKQGYIPFVVRSERKAALVFIHADDTDQAYNNWGGKSLYDFNSSGKAAYKVSYNRPFAETHGAGRLLGYEYHMIRWLEKQGYDVDYVSNVDVATHGELLTNRRGILVVGHNEYWTHEMRQHVEAAVGTGVNVAFFAGNSIWWQIRYEPSAANNHAPNRTVVCYKSATNDPFTGKDNTRVTVNFYNPPLHWPEQPFLGEMSAGYGSYNNPLRVADASSWIYAGTGAKNGDLIGDIVGYEWDNINPAYPIPAGVHVFAASSLAKSTIYTAKSGARIIDVGTQMWPYGLDSFQYKNVTTSLAQKMTHNILKNFLTANT